MNPKPVIPRLLALQDVDEAIAHQVEAGSRQTALAFIDALEAAFNHIGSFPESGSPRHAHELDIPGLRSWPLSGLPFLIFYIERQDHVDVWRVLHQRMDIPTRFE